MERVKLIDICDKIVLFSLYATAFFIPISKALIELFTTLAIVCYIVKKFIQRKGIPKANINLAIFIYLIICFFSIFISSNFKISTRTFFSKYMQNITFFFVVVDTLNNEQRIRNIIYILLMSSLLLGIDGIYQHFTHKDFIRHRPYYGLPRVHATFPTSNSFGCYLISVIPFALIFSFAKYRTKIFRFLAISLFILLFACLMLTVSRGAWFGFMSSVLFMSIWIKPLGIFFLTVGICIMTTQQFYYSFLKERLSHFFIFEDNSSADRMVIWQIASRMFMARPWLGVGLGTFMFNFSKFVIGGYQFGIPYAHNCYLQMASEIGIVGLASFLFILILFFYYGIKALNTTQKNFSWYVLLASLSSILGYCVQMVVDTIFYSLDLSLLFWLMLALGVAVMNNIKEVIK